MPGRGAGLGLNEVREALQTMAYNKAAGMDSMPTEMLKAMNQNQMEYVVKFFNKIWEERKAPDDWRKGVIVKTSKKGNLKDCNIGEE